MKSGSTAILNGEATYKKWSVRTAFLNWIVNSRRTVRRMSIFRTLIRTRREGWFGDVGDALDPGSAPMTRVLKGTAGRGERI